MAKTGKPRTFTVYDLRLQFDAWPKCRKHPGTQSKLMLERVNKVLQENQGYLNGAQLLDSQRTMVLEEVDK